jgi:hypothetical protein
MTFFPKESRRSELRRITTTKPGLVVLALVAAVVSVGGYVLFLAVLAPEQLAEATAAATDLVCAGCVGTSDIADSAVTSAKIGSGQVKTTDLGASAVTSAKIGDGQVTSADIADGTISSTDIASGAIQITRVQGSTLQIGPGGAGTQTVNCPRGEILTGGGFSASNSIRVGRSIPLDADTWEVFGFNQSGNNQGVLTPYALCV